ncbi:hypothetical protein ACFQ07_26010 [Actinomadura adrarensis]|uniref:Uncharacterized protein n=1 Tax=Actinomadura adrarensis TaxID=1819600 RepID=A0ABW3CQ80_9ACTN
MLWSMEMSSHWVEIEADPKSWLLLPSVFPIDRWQDDLAWAMDQADAVWDASGLPRRRKHLKQLAKALMISRAHMAQRGAWSHLSFVYLPDPTTRPMFLGVGVWRAQGERDEALRFYSCADAPGTKEAEEITTEHLGTGLRALAGLDDEPGGGVLGYAFRAGDHTDLCVTVMEDKGRLPELIPDVDAFVQRIRVVSDEQGEQGEGSEGGGQGEEGEEGGKGAEKEDEGDGPLTFEADSFLQVIGWVEKSIAELEEEG